MRSPRGPVPVEVLRDAAQRAVESTSLRYVAAAVGMVPSGLENFLSGAPPRARTVRKLREWYVRNAAGIGEASHETAKAAFAVLLDGIPPGADREAVLREILEVIVGAHVANRTEPPRWLKNFRPPEPGG